jgi:tetratricopeptide (TPR) repeat protein
MLPARTVRKAALGVLSGSCLALSVVWLGACSKQGASRSLASAPLQREEAEGTAPAHTELLRVTITLNEDGTYKREEHHRYRILDRSGVENWGYTSAYYSPWYMKPPRIQARVTNGQSTTPLDPKLLTQEPAHPSAPDIYGDSLIIRGPLPTVRVGSIIEETIVTETHKPFLAPNSLHYVTFASSIPKDKVELIVDAPASMKVNFEVRDAQVERSERVERGRRIVTFEGGPSKALEQPEPLISTELPYWPAVVFSSGVGWPELADIYAKIVEERLTGVNFQAIVSEVVAKSDSDRLKMAKLHAWVKERVRYIGVEFGESSVVPYTPDEVVARGFGDCKDQATLLVGLLRAAGFEANVALLRAGSGEDVMVSLPALDVFNHAIVHVGGKEPFWIDPTADFLPLGSLPTPDQDRFALVASPSTRELVKTPASESADNAYSEERTLTLQDQGKAHVTETSHGTGALDAELRSSFAMSEEEIRKDLKGYVERVYGTEVLGDVKHGDASAVMVPYSLHLETKGATVGHTSLLEATADLAEATVLNWVPDALRAGDEERKSDMHLRLPYSAELVWNVRPPKGFIALEMPEPITRQFGASRMVRTVETFADGSMRMRTKFDSGKRHLSAREVNEFREQYQLWAEGRRPGATFEHRSRKLVRDGDVPAAVRLLRSDVDQAPSVSLPRLRLAQTIDTFIHEAAQEEVRRAVKLEPKNFESQLQAGHMLTDNLVGEDMGRGFDREGALAAYRRAVELDGKSIHAKVRLANVLETNAAGERYFASREDLERALEVYASIPQKELLEYNEGNHRNSALFTLFWARKYDELRAKLTALPLEDVPTELSLMNEAGRTRTVEGVLAESERLHLKDENRSQAMEQAARAFTSARLYREAEVILKEAMESSGNPDRLQSRLTMTRHAKPVSIEGLPTNTPQTVALKVLVHAIVARKVDVAFLRPLLAKDAQLKGEKSYVIKRLETVNVSQSTGNLTEEVLGDLIYGAMHASVEGSDKVGYRVKITQETAQSGVKHTFYVVKEDGAYKVRAFEPRSSELGAEALSATARKNDAMAKQWLDWARETFDPYEDKEPLRVLAFSQAWPDAQGKKKGNVSVETAAALLAVQADSAERALPVLKAALTREKEQDVRILILSALYMAEAHLEDHAASLKTADVLSSLLPESVPAFWKRTDALVELGRYADVEQAIRARLAKGIESERIGLTQALASALVARGKIADGMMVRRGLIEKREASGNDYNSQAWDGLFVGVTAEHLEYALRSVEVSKDSMNLHTLATVYVELGKLNDAARTMRELLKRRKHYEPLPADYYVLGRMAELLGYEVLANTYYEKVEKPEKASVTSTYELARKRLSKR